MYNLPIFFKIVLNFIAYIFYTVFFSIVFSIVFPLILKLFWLELLNPNNPVFSKIQIILALLMLLITAIYRKYFYISLSKNEPNIINEKKTETKQKKAVVEHFMDDDDIKIYVDKEIKR